MRNYLTDKYRKYKAIFGKMGSFLLLLIVYFLAKIIVLGLGTRFTKGPLFKKIIFKSSKLYDRVICLLDSQHSGTISRVDLIELSLRNMKTKITRTYITVGGMVIGIGVIVFLVSLGYGVENMVVTRVARLDEMRQADVSPQAGGKVKITDKSMADFKEISKVEMALPLIAVVGRVNYLNSLTDVAVYGVTTDYLKQSAIKPVVGKVFDSNELSFDVSHLVGQVAGVSTERETGTFGEKIQDIDFTIDQGTWIRVRENPSTSGKILGYTKRVEGLIQGEEVWGDEYESEDGQPSEKWIKSSVLFWKREKCDMVSQGDCEGGKYLVSRDKDGKQIQKTGYFAKIGIRLSGVNITEPEVLGVSTETSASAGVDWVEIASEAGVIKPPDTKSIDLSSSAKRQAVVNRAMLLVLGIKESEAVGKKFNTSFVVVGDLLSDPTANIESVPAEYTIVGVTPEEKTPVFYVPFIDLRTLGITNFSQAKIVVKEQNELPKTRQQIESMGYVTRSVADTVAQINSLFATARAVLVLLGMVALAVAALGMFNTLTVSLLERTREVGLMKAMGMKSSEIQELFLTESMIMGFFGGILGIVLGWILGKIVSIVLSFFAVFKGVGFVDISYVPFSLIVAVIFLSFFVGIVTGIYPARRATKISALNALRYE